MKKILFFIVIICACSLSSLHANNYPKLYVTMSQAKVQTGDVLYLSAFLEESKWKIQNQKWYLDGAVLATNYGAPYKLEMQIGENIKPGEHTIKALAICKKGKKIINITEERKIIIEKTNYPKSNNIFYFSTSNKDYFIGQTIQVSVLSKSKDYKLSHVNLYFGDKFCGTVNDLPFHYNIILGKTVRPGKYKVHGMAIGNSGTTARIEYVVLYVDVKDPNSPTSKVPSKVKGLSTPITIWGQVLDDSNNNPVIGATVSVVGIDGEYGAITDFDGKYKLNVPKNAKKLKYSYFGYLTAELDLFDGMSGNCIIYLHPE